MCSIIHVDECRSQITALNQQLAEVRIVLILYEYYVAVIHGLSTQL